jgi:hypothetical protein
MSQNDWNQGFVLGFVAGASPKPPKSGVGKTSGAGSFLAHRIKPFSVGYKRLVYPWTPKKILPTSSSSLFKVVPFCKHKFTKVG